MSLWELPCGDKGRFLFTAHAHRTLTWWPSHSCPDPAVGTGLLCWATLCLLGQVSPKNINISVFYLSRDYSNHFLFHFRILSFPCIELRKGGVIQSPRHKVIEKVPTVNFWYDPISGHQTLYWCWQTLGQSLGLLIRFENEAALEDSQLPKKQLSAERPNAVDSSLKIPCAELGDSAVYFCTNSLATRHSDTTFLCTKH